MTTFEYVTSKLGKVKPETLAIAEELYYAAKAAGHEIWFMWGMGTSAEHKTGLALDLMVRNEAAGDWIRDYIWTNRKRLRLRHVIWEQHITSTVVEPGVRRKMADRGNPTANHYDHIHTWHFEGVYQKPEDSTTKPKPPATPEKLVVDGKLGPKTITRWQQVMKTPVDGKIDTDKPSSLVKAVQRRLKATVESSLKVDGYGIQQNGKRYKTVGALQRYLKSPVDEKIDKPVSKVVKALQRRLNEDRF